MRIITTIQTTHSKRNNYTMNDATVPMQRVLTWDPNGPHIWPEDQKYNHKLNEDETCPSLIKTQLDLEDISNQ